MLPAAPRSSPCVHTERARNLDGAAARGSEAGAGRRAPANGRRAPQRMAWRLSPKSGWSHKQRTDIQRARDGTAQEPLRLRDVCGTGLFTRHDHRTPCLQKRDATVSAPASYTSTTRSRGTTSTVHGLQDFATSCPGLSNLIVMGAYLTVRIAQAVVMGETSDVGWRVRSHPILKS
jgi:hypothetical protein